MPRYFAILTLTLGLILPSSSGRAEVRVNLDSGDHLTGKLLAITEDGKVNFQPLHSTSAVTAIPTAVHSINFPEKGSATHPINEEITFNNGDSLFCNITGIDSDSLSFNTWFAKDFSVDRALVKKIQFHRKASSQKLLSNIKWSNLQRKQPWSITSDSLICKGLGEIYHKSPLTQNFIAQYSVQWTRKQTSFRIYLCADASEVSKVNDCYYLEATNKGLALYRSTKARPQQQLADIPVILRNKKNSTVDIAIKVDRRTQQVAVIIDHKSTTIVDDPELSAPLGEFMLIQSRVPKSSSLKVTDVKFFEWTGNLLSANKVNSNQLDESVDTLIDKQGRTLKGEVVKTASKGSSLFLVFNDTLKNELHQVPLDQTKEVHLKQPGEASMVLSGTYTLALQGETQFSVSSLTIKDDQVSVKSPTLGPFTFNTSALKKLTRVPSNRHE